MDSTPTAPTAPATPAYSPAKPWSGGYNPYSGPQTIMQGPGYEGIPSVPGYNPQWTPQQALAPKYQQQVDANSQGFNAYRDQAMQKGPSSWANLANQQQGLEAQSQMEKGAKVTGANNAGALSQLAAQGGLTSGARERAIESGANNLTDMSQGVVRQEGLNKLQIGLNDAQNRMQMLSMIPGMEQQRTQGWADMNKTDLANQIAEAQAMNAYGQHLSDQRLQAWGANQQANATANSSPNNPFGNVGDFIKGITQHDYIKDVTQHDYAKDAGNVVNSVVKRLFGQQ